MDWKRIFSFGRSIESKAFSEESGISDEALTIIKKNAKGRLQPFKRTDLYTDKSEIAGICVETKQEEAEHLVLKLREELQQLNYLVFISDSEREMIGIIKGYDQFVILKNQQTNGDNYDITNEMVISKLKEWHRRYPFTIIGADYDWVEANFKMVPEGKELKVLAKEIYKFCPDIVEQGSGSINGLMEEMKATGKLFLWWD